MLCCNSYCDSLYRAYKIKNNGRAQSALCTVSTGDQRSLSAACCTALGTNFLAPKTSAVGYDPSPKQISAESLSKQRPWNDSQLGDLHSLTYTELIYWWSALELVNLRDFMSVVSMIPGQWPSKSWWASWRGETWECSPSHHLCSDLSSEEIGWKSQNKLCLDARSG